MRVVLTGWKPGLLKISLNGLLREYAGYSLKEAKSAVDRLLDEEAVQVEIESREAASEFLRRASDLGAIGHLGSKIRLMDAASPVEIDLARSLFSEYQQAIGVDLCFQSFDEELRGLPGAYAPPRGRILLAYEDDALVGCGALRPLSQEVAELKRMWVRPAFRGRGLGRRIAEALLAAAREEGYRAARLDTLQSMREAIALYRSLGFLEIPPYYANPLTGALYMELAL